MEKCWIGNPEDRPTFLELVSTTEDILCGVSDYVELDMDLRHETQEYGMHFYSNLHIMLVDSLTHK